MIHSEPFELVGRSIDDHDMHIVTDLAIAALQGDPDSPYDRDAALDTLEDGDVRVVRDNDGRIAAMYKLGAMENEQAWLEMLAVASDKRRRGLGSYALDCVYREAHTQGATSLVLHVNEHNEKAVQFYRKNGFFEDGGNGDYVQMSRAIP